MPSVTKVNPAGVPDVGVINGGVAGANLGQSLGFFLVTIKDVGANAIDLRAEDNAPDDGLDLIMQVIQPLAYFAANAATGVIHVITDGHNNSAAELQQRIRAMGTDVRGVDVSGTTVAAGTSFTIA